MLVNPEELEKSYKENKENVSEALRKRREAEKYRNFKQLVNAFYGKEESLQEESIKLEDTANIKIEPKILYNSFYKTLKVEFKIGDKQLYKLKDLTEFFIDVEFKPFQKKMVRGIVVKDCAKMPNSFLRRKTRITDSLRYFSSISPFSMPSLR